MRILGVWGPLAEIYYCHPFIIVILEARKGYPFRTCFRAPADRDLVRKFCFQTSGGFLNSRTRKLRHLKLKGFLSEALEEHLLL